MFERLKMTHHWEGKMEPFRIVGNVYFVGTYPASSHLIDTGAGLILIDTGYADTLFMVVDSIHRLGFDPMDIKYIINTHWHGDHTAGTAALAGFTGAKTLIGWQDAEKAKQYFTPDILVHDGDILTLGNTKISFMETPGHTKGTISFFLDTEEGGKTYRVGSFGGAGANTLAQGKTASLTAPCGEVFWTTVKSVWMPLLQRRIKYEICKLSFAFHFFRRPVYPGAAVGCIANTV